ncbi:MAG: hypothetical protein DRQ42_09815 [Gammaproteobacteria bacterium]|nr:MAG: hypothetical protein DRQ42_09815 [Gammaproteobacteria bacterium]
MTVLTSGFLQNSGASLRFAPDLTWPSRVTSAGVETAAALDMSGSLQTALELTGKYAISYLNLYNLTAEVCTIKLTVDGVVIWNATFTPGTTLPLLGSIAGQANGNNDMVMQCDSSFLLEIQTAADTSIDLDYIARPIL